MGGGGEGVREEEKRGWVEEKEGGERKGHLIGK